MTALQVALLVVGAAAAFALSAYTYFRREPVGRGRAVLIALRTLALTMLVLLLLDPRFDLGGSRRGRGGPRVVLDASLSMSLGADANRAWNRAVAEATRASRGGTVLLAGNGVQTVPVDSLNRIAPYAGDSRMLPALQSAAEAGANRVVLITDAAIEDAADVARWLPTLGLTLDVRRVGDARTLNRAVSSVEAPAWAEATKPLTMRVSVASNAAGRGSVIVRQNGNVVARADVTLIADGVVSTALTFNAQGPAQGGLVRYDVALEQRDSIPDDDVRSVYVFISERPAGVAIVSFDPDWEPRFLHPVIESALGLPVRTFLRVPGFYVRGGSGLDAGGRVDESVVRRALAQADLLVLHGIAADAPDWAQEAAGSARRLIVFPGDAGLQLPAATSAATEADWYISADLPASPITPLLAGIDASVLPPLTALQATVVSDNAWVPLFGGRTRRGGTTPVIVAEERTGRRWVIALGSGYWRWAFRGGAARDAYTRLWAALAGWVVQDRAQVAGAAIRPVERAVPRGTPLRWIAPGVNADSLVLALRSAAGALSRFVMTSESGDTAASAAPPPGHYTYDIAAYRDGAEVARARGALTAETYSPEFMRRPVDIEQLTKAVGTLASVAGTAGRPLHTYPWLYVALVILICAEWILRRRWGLR